MYSTKLVTKEEILSKIPQEKIFEKYLKIKPEYGKGFVNPLRVDNHADCYFYIDDRNMIKFHDIPKKWNWDCFAVVCVIYNCNFYTSLRIIAQDFNLEELTEQVELIKKQQVNLNTLKSEKKSIKIKVRKWYTFDLQYWKQFNVTLKELNFFNVFAVESAFLNDSCIYQYRSLKQVCYCYYLGNKNMKLYFPFREKGGYPRFYHNDSGSIQGLDQLPPTGEFLIITKSMKDVISMFTFELDAIANISETIAVPKYIMENLKKRFKVIYTLYDKDRVGVSMSLKMEKEYGTIPLLFTSDTLFAKKDEKDFTDNLIKHGEQYMLDLIKKFKKWHNSNLKLLTMGRGSPS